jgi:hypothetical protein
MNGFPMLHSMPTVDLVVPSALHAKPRRIQLSGSAYTELASA